MLTDPYFHLLVFLLIVFAAYVASTRRGRTRIVGRVVLGICGVVFALGGDLYFILAIARRLG
jgi:drug/metabolite transporter (DMT)-like permease